jgi:hypothetical protein
MNKSIKKNQLLLWHMLIGSEGLVAKCFWGEQKFFCLMNFEAFFYE